MKVFKNLPAGAPANDMSVIIEGSLMRLYFGYKKEEPAHKTTGNSMRRIEDDTYSCENIDIVQGRTYGEITAAIIADKYDGNAVQAIIANKALADDAASNITAEKRKEYLTEYAAFQTYRAKAKALANQALAIISADD